MYYDRQGQPISRQEWIESFGADRHVAEDTVGHVWVSTVWVGLNHNFWGTGPPLIFETMVFGGAHNEDCWRYPTEMAALAGHDQVVAMVREGPKCACPGCERCTWNPGPDCGRAEHPHCERCGHCVGRHVPVDAPDA